MDRVFAVCLSYMFALLLSIECYLSPASVYRKVARDFSLPRAYSVCLFSVLYLSGGRPYSPTTNLCLSCLDTDGLPWFDVCLWLMRVLLIGMMLAWLGAPSSLENLILNSSSASASSTNACLIFRFLLFAVAVNGAGGTFVATVLLYSVNLYSELPSFSCILSPISAKASSRACFDVELLRDRLSTDPRTD